MIVNRYILDELTKDENLRDKILAKAKLLNIKSSDKMVLSPKGQIISVCHFELEDLILAQNKYMLIVPNRYIEINLKFIKELYFLTGRE